MLWFYGLVFVLVLFVLFYFLFIYFLYDLVVFLFNGLFEENNGIFIFLFISDIKIKIKYGLLFFVYYVNGYKKMKLIMML